MKCRRPNCPNSASAGRHRGYCPKHYARVPKGLVDAAECKAHFSQLRQAGYSQRAISQLSRLHEDTLRNLGTWTDASRVVLSTHDKIMSIPLPADVFNGGAQDVPNVGTKRRIRALMAFGYSLDHLGRELGVTPQNVNHWQRRQYVSAQTVDTVRELFNRLQLTPGPSKRSRSSAARKGWAPPFAWDEDSIEDPNETPRSPRADKDAWIGDYQELRELGRTHEQIAERWGMLPESLRQRLRRINALAG